MTLDEFEKVMEEKRKALLALKSEERKVEIDKDLLLWSGSRMHERGLIVDRIKGLAQVI
jgi:hypothetical protein